MSVLSEEDQIQAWLDLAESTEANSETTNENVVCAVNTALGYDGLEEEGQEAEFVAKLKGSQVES